MAVDVITSYSKYSWDAADRTAGNLPGFGDNSDITPQLHDTGFERDAESGEEYYTYNGTTWVKRNTPASEIVSSKIAVPVDLQYNQLDETNPLPVKTVAFGDEGFNNTTKAHRVTTEVSRFMENCGGPDLNEDLWETTRIGTSAPIISLEEGVMRFSYVTGAQSGSMVLLTLKNPVTFPGTFKTVFKLSTVTNVNAAFGLNLTPLNDDGTTGKGSIEAVIQTSILTGTKVYLRTGNGKNTDANNAATCHTKTTEQIFELEVTPDEVYFHFRPLDSTSAKTYTVCHNKYLPDLTKKFKFFIHAGVIGGKTITGPLDVDINSISYYAYNELQAKVMGKGGNIPSQAIPVTSTGDVALAALPTGSNSIGKVTLNAGAAIVGKVGIDSASSGSIKLSGSNVVNADTITPSDTEDLVNPTIGLFVGTEGDLKVTLVGGQTINMKNLAGGVWHPISATKVFATDTSATDILGAW